MEILCVKEVEQNPLPKSQTKPFYIGTKEAPSEYSSQKLLHIEIMSTGDRCNVHAYTSCIGTERIYDRTETETRKSQARCQIIQVSYEDGTRII